MPKSIWLKILSGVYHCDIRPIGSEVSVFEVSEAYQARYGFFFFFTLSQTIHDVNFLRNTQHLWNHALCFNSNVLSIVVKRNDICNSGDFARTEMNIHVVLSTELWIKTGSYVFMRIS